MLGAAQAQFPILQLKSQQVDVPQSLRDDCDKLLSRIRIELTTAQEIDDDLIPEVFSLRWKVVKHFKTELYSQLHKGFSLSESDFYLPYATEHYITFNQNLEFAIRSINRITSKIVDVVSNSGITPSNLDNLELLPGTEYWTFIDLTCSLLPESIGNNVIEWIDASLELEFCLLCAFLIREEKLVLSDDVVDDLSTLIAEAAQTYVALALVLQILPTTPPQNLYILNDSEDFINEQKEMANRGLLDWENGLDK